MAFGAFIRSEREKKEIQMNDFARQLGISPAYWSRIERDIEKRSFADDELFSGDDIAEQRKRFDPLDFGEESELAHIDAHDRNASFTHEPGDAQKSSVPS